MPKLLAVAAALAAGMGVGRFVFTPILPLMQAQAGLSPHLGAALATANYAGYLLGAAAGIALPALTGSRMALRGSLVTLVSTLALMPVFPYAGAWLTLRLIAGVASAVVFVIAAQAVLAEFRAHLVGWAFGGIGLGIALSGALMLRSSGSWQSAWFAAAALASVFAALSWPLTPGRPTASTASDGRSRWFVALVVCYTLEGVGYIIAGTFLVAAIDQRAPGALGAGAWVVVGVAAVPSAALWAHLGRRRSRPTLLLAVLIAQAIGIALPVFSGSVLAALVSAVLFGGTFLGAVTLALAVGTHLRVARSAPVLTTAYAVGQIAGPLVVAPLLRDGYSSALLTGSVIVGCGAVAAAFVRHRFPERVPA
ncbi:YbfB/YjiJ family MFS transporter [Actinoplanes sp. NPDC051411]|uniref:YbfB/YjiJ family MFS transporter n=1 Tax=Actinoplanes sp. NPDC051411 TaxID=3155522 RepID=UPI00341FF574